MRLLSRLLVALVICLIAIALPPGSVQAYGEEIVLSPSSGVPGEKITVYGFNFTPDKMVDIYYYPNDDEEWVEDIPTRTDGSFIVTFTIRESYTGYHRVLADEVGSTIYAATYFNVKPGLTVSPEEGTVGTNVTVEGHGFAEEEEHIKVYFNGEMVPVNIPPADEYGSWETSFPIPPSARKSYKIDARGDDSSFSQVKDATFEVTPGISLDELSGSVGDNITMTGNGFTAGERDIKILFDGEVVEVDTDIRADDKGYWPAIFQVPEMPKGTYSVTAEGEWTDKEDITPHSFEIKPCLVLSPVEGHVGMNLTVTGHGFDASKDVVIKYDGRHKATASTNASGSFSGVSFLVPEGIHGAHYVTAEVGGVTETTAIFTMESVPPGTPNLISPPDRDRVGFIGKQRPTFEWSEVSDDSGVRYSLQIATSTNVTDTGFIDDLVFSDDGLVETSYKLNKTALDYGTYYWIVRAVDRAGNAGNWTVAYSFRVGILPLWAFIVIIVAIVAGIGTAVYFFVIRKRIYYY